MSSDFARSPTVASARFSRSTMRRFVVPRFAVPSEVLTLSIGRYIIARRYLRKGIQMTAPPVAAHPVAGTLVRAGSFADLQRDGRLLTKVGSLPVVVFWLDGEAYAIE